MCVCVCVCVDADVCLRYLKVDWSGILLTDDMEHVIPFSKKGNINMDR